jgi:hypothetical protein
LAGFSWASSSPAVNGGPNKAKGRGRLRVGYVQPQLAFDWQRGLERAVIDRGKPPTDVFARSAATTQLAGVAAAYSASPRWPLGWYNPLMRLQNKKQGESFTVPGIWWVPGDSPAKQVSGELQYDVGHMRLRLGDFLRGCKGNSSFDIRPEDDAPPVIHGTSEFHEDLTLYQSWYQSWKPTSLRGTSVSEAVLVTHVLLVGGHFESIESQQFHSCSFRISAVDDWIGHSAFDTVQEGEGDAACWVTRGRLGKPVFSSLAQIGGGPRSISLEHKWSIALTPPNPKALEWFVERIRHAERLLTLLVGVPVHTERVVLYPSAEKSIVAGRFQDGASLYAAHKRAEEKEIRPHEFLISYESLKPHLGSVLAKWFAIDDSIEHALHLFFSTLYQPGSYLETKFLPTIQSLEVLARETYDSAYVPSERFSSIVESLTSAIGPDVPGDLADSITSKLSFANQLSLKDLLKRAIRELHDEARVLFCVDSDQFVNGIVNTRNFHTHTTAPTEKSFAEWICIGQQ